jgi:hypothetical protein
MTSTASSSSNESERVAAVLEAILSGCKPEHAAHYGDWTPDEFADLCKERPDILREVQLTESKWACEFEMKINKLAEGNASAANLVLQSRVGYNVKDAQLKAGQTDDADDGLAEIDLDIGME